MLRRAARFPVKAKISAWIGLVVILGLLSMLYMYRGLGRVSEYLNHLALIDVPLSLSTIEMEKNSQEYSSGVLRYLELARPDVREEAENDHADFLKSHATYVRLSAGEVEADAGAGGGDDPHHSPGAGKLEIGQRIADEHGWLHAMGGALMKQRDELDLAFRQANELLEGIDEVIDHRLPPVLPVREAARNRALAAMTSMEAQAAEVGFWLAAHDSRPTALTRQRVLEKLEELAQAIAGYHALPLSTRERQFGADIGSLHERAAASIGALLTREEEYNVLLGRFIEREAALDALFDGEVEALTRQSLAEPQIKADRAMQRAQVALRYVIPSYLLVALAAGVLLILAIVRPLRRLASGTEAIGAGDLDYRVAEHGQDEFAALARQFNRMVAQLQETTVSKSRLEASESRLRLTVDELRQEMVERERAEREREKLRAKLLRSEAMAAMGMLVAGVAHEVRNPLFGISSTLDAMEASGDANASGARYRTVLRREANRMSKLMASLLEYGRPATDALTAGSLGRVVAEAVQVCTPGAEAAGVVIVNAVNGDWTVRLHRSRLVQLFANLIENAVQYAPPGTEVTVDAGAVADAYGRPWVECRVQDRGAGIAPEDLPHLFDPFFTRRRKGTGLGLSIVQRIVEEHEGEIVPANRADGGATMTVRLPLDEGSR